MPLTDGQLKRQVFKPVIKHLKDRTRLRSLKTYTRICPPNRPGSGIEGWLKVETVAALALHDGPIRVERIQARPDLRLQNGTGTSFLELKAETGPASYRNLITNGLLHPDNDGAPVLFLCRDFPAQARKTIHNNGNLPGRLLCHAIINDGDNDWLLGIVILPPNI